MPKQRSKPSKKRKRADTVGWTDGPSITSVGAIVGRVGAQGQTLGTVGWTDCPLFSSVGRVAEESKEDSSTGWSDGLSGDPVGLSDA
jgi:hypothetical protein